MCVLSFNASASGCLRMIQPFIMTAAQAALMEKSRVCARATDEYVQKNP